MKKKILFILSLFMGLIACNDSNEFPFGRNIYSIAVPLTADLHSFKEEAIDITEPVDIVESGKIYAYKNYIFINDVGRGLHVVDNTNPRAPEKISFIKLEGNHDVSIKNDRLYADSYGDLVIMDISDISNIGNVKRLENAIYQEFWCTVGFDVEWPTADAFDYGDFDASKEAIVGWEVKRIPMSQSEFNEKYRNVFALEDASANTTAAPNADTGQGGSLARFRIVDDYLYAVEWSSINVFDISDLDSPEVLDEVYTSGGIETIFNQGDLLFLGGTRGMYIYDISEPSTPTFISDFEHGTACDPVVVDGDYAYVTLRGGNFCGAVESGLYIIDIANIEKPELKVIYPMDEPYGLGVKDDKLFVCDGTSGLKVYDKSSVPDLPQLNHFKDIVTFDVIPLESHLIMVGDEVLYQYEYLDDDIKLLSQIGLN
ncbi:LVIVD repeat-containing protein [Flagellimonas sp. 2504JD4-2]